MRTEIKDIIEEEFDNHMRMYPYETLEDGEKADIYSCMCAFVRALHATDNVTDEEVEKIHEDLDTWLGF